MKREPGEIEFWNRRSKKWVKNKKVCFVSESQLCDKPGCNRKCRTTSNSSRILINGRFCGYQCSTDVRVEIHKNEAVKS